MIIQGQTVEALQQFYHTDVVVVEPDGFVRKGRDTNIDNERKNRQGISALRATLLNYACNAEKNTIFAEWEFLFTDLAGESFKLREVSVQEWKDGCIVAERFYYKGAVSVK